MTMTFRFDLSNRISDFFSFGRLLIALLALISSPFFVRSLAAQEKSQESTESQDKPPFTLTWKNKEGERLNPNWKTKGEWTGQGIFSSATFYRLWVHVPQPFVVNGASSGSTVIRREKSHSLQEEFGNPGEILAFDLRNSDSDILIKVTNTKTGQISDLELKVKLHPRTLSPNEVAEKYVAPTSRFRLSPNLGISYLDYQEASRAIQVSQVGLTGKLTASFILIRDVLDFATNGFMTLATIPVSINPASQPAARFYGINARVGVQIPFPIAGLDWKISPGVYNWGMIVSNNAYGIRSIRGPQIFLSAQSHSRPWHPWSIYFKYATLSEQGKLFSTTDRELAFGGNVQLNGAYAPRPWSLTIDLSSAAFNSTAVRSSARLYQWSLGVQTPL